MSLFHSNWLIRPFSIRLKAIRGRTNTVCGRKHVHTSTVSRLKQSANYLTLLWSTVMLSALLQKQWAKWLLQHSMCGCWRFMDGNLRSFWWLGFVDQQKVAGTQIQVPSYCNKLFCNSFFLWVVGTETRSPVALHLNLLCQIYMFNI